MNLGVGEGSDSGQSRESRLRRLVGYLEHDPSNLKLLEEAAQAAFDVRLNDQAQALIDRYKILSPLPPGLINLEALVSLRDGRIVEAAEAFDALLDGGFDSSSIRFNRAWVYALGNDYENVLRLLDADAIAVGPQAAALKIQAFHHLGRLEEALAEGAELAERFPRNDALLGALSVVAMDDDDFELARDYSERAEGGPDALTTRGLISLHEDDVTKAIQLFDHALADHPGAPRALMGKGLALAASGQISEGVDFVLRGAETFGDHLGSWIAAGWMQVLAKDLGSARETFQKVLTLDENFAESHGGLAVIDIAEGDLASAKRRAEIAIRLDKECFGGMLAQMMLRDSAGNQAGAQRIWDKAMGMAVGVNGKSLAQTMMGLGFNPAKRQRGDL